MQVACASARCGELQFAVTAAVQEPSARLPAEAGSGTLKHAPQEDRVFTAIWGMQTRTLNSSRRSWPPEIIKSLDRQVLSVRAAHDRTGIAASDFSRIRNADLGRCTLDRLMSTINRLGSRVEVKIRRGTYQG